MQDINVLGKPQLSPERVQCTDMKQDDAIHFDIILKRVDFPIPFRPTKPYLLPYVMLRLADDSKTLQEMEAE